MNGVDLMRWIILIVLFGLSVGSYGSIVPNADFVNLDRPGTLSGLRLERPDHYAVIASIVCGGHSEELLKARYRLSRIDTSTSGLWKTTYPPQGWIQISIEDTTYLSRGRIIASTCPFLRAD